MFCDIGMYLVVQSRCSKLQLLLERNLPMPGKFEIYRDEAGEYRFRLRATNGETILASEGYRAKASCFNGLESVKKNALYDSFYERKQTPLGKFMFNLKATNGRVVGKSECYETTAARDNGIESVKKNAPDAEVVEIIS